MDGLARVNGELDLFFHHALGDSGVVDGIDILGLFVEVAVEIHTDRFLAVDGHVVDETALIQEVERGFRHHMHLHRRRSVAFPAIGQCI